MFGLAIFYGIIITYLPCLGQRADDAVPVARVGRECELLMSPQVHVVTVCEQPLWGYKIEVRLKCYLELSEVRLGFRVLVSLWVVEVRLECYQ